MLGNKICVTEKGLDLLSDSKNEFQVEQKPNHNRTSSLPTIRSVQLSKRQTITQRLAKNQKLSRLTTRLQKIEKVGLRGLIIKQQDKILTKLLKQQMKHKQKYLNALIPNIVKKTRDPNKTNNIDSRFNRSRAYTQRLLQNYASQKNFGVSNHLRKGQKNNEQEQGQNKTKF